jgi:hypothetical protein
MGSFSCDRKRRSFTLATEMPSLHPRRPKLNHSRVFVSIGGCFAFLFYLRESASICGWFCGLGKRLNIRLRFA